MWRPASNAAKISHDNMPNTVLWLNCAGLPNSSSENTTPLASVSVSSMNPAQMMRKSTASIVSSGGKFCRRCVSVASCSGRSERQHQRLKPIEPVKEIADPVDEHGQPEYGRDCVSETEVQAVRRKQ